MESSLFRFNSSAIQQLALPFRDPRESLESIFSTVHRELKPRTPVPRIQIRFFPFAGINHTARLNQGLLTIRVSDIFDGAPEEVIRALALILLAKLYKKQVDANFHRTYRTYILRGEVQERARVVRTTRGRSVRLIEARGRYFDLETLFLQLNSKYFDGGLDKPKISWSAKRSKYILGRYDSTHHTIFISRVFDSAKVPDYVIKYVMFHEMLHVKHQTRVKDCRMVVHTPEFKRDERTFTEYESAKAWLKAL